MPCHSPCRALKLKAYAPQFIRLVLHRLKEAGYQGYVVGGAVRDACLQRPISDWDVVTSAPSEKIKAVFADIRYFSLKQGSVTLVDAGRHYEVTPFREGQNHVNGDLAHRDFTINTLAWDPDTNTILDPFGGKTDLERRIIRAVQDPAARFSEDPLRLLRAIRLTTELGFRIEAETLKHLTRMASLLSHVAVERVREELIRLLTAPSPSMGFTLMRKTGLLGHILPELLEGYRRRQNTYHRYTIYAHIMETLDRVPACLSLRLTALLHDIAKPRVRQKKGGVWRFPGHEKASARLAEEIMDRLKFSKDTIRKVTRLIAHHMIGYDPDWSDGAIRRLIRRVGRQNMSRLLFFRRADILAHGVHDDKLDLLRQLEDRINGILKTHVVVHTRDLAIDGHKVMEILGVHQGPEVGQVLNILMEQVAEKPRINTEKGLTALLEQMKRSRR